VGNISLKEYAGRHYVYAVLSAIKGELSEQLLLPFVLLLLLQLFADVLERLLIEGTALACGEATNLNLNFSSYTQRKLNVYSSFEFIVYFLRLAVLLIYLIILLKKKLDNLKL